MNDSKQHTSPRDDTDHCSPIERLLAALRAADREPRRRGDGWESRCPSHDDRRASLSIGVGADGQALLHCHTGCETRDVLASIGLSLCDLYPDDDSPPRQNGQAAKRASTPATDWRRIASDANRQLDEAALVRLASGLGVSVESLRRLGIVWLPAAFLRSYVPSGKLDGQDGAFALPMTAADGRVIGLQARIGSDKVTLRGGKLGLFAPTGLPDDGRIYITEGASDCASLLTLNLPTIGVAAAGRGGDDAARWLGGREVIIVADADDAGRRGATKIAEAIAKAQGRSVRVAEPPGGCKDARAWLASRSVIGEGADAIDAERHNFVDHVQRTARTVEPATDNQSQGRAGAAITRTLSDVAPESVRWLWPGRVPLGKVSTIVGDPGLGKSLVTLDIAARTSRGLPWPDGAEACAPGGVVIASAEDDPGDTIRPRFDGAGGDPSKVTLLEGIRRGDGAEAGVTLEDIPQIEAAIDAGLQVADRRSRVGVLRRARRE